MVAFSSQLFGDVTLSEHIHARKLTNRCPKLISLPPREVYSSQVSITILASWNAFGREVLCRDCEIRCGHGQKDKPTSFFKIPDAPCMEYLPEKWPFQREMAK